MVNNFEFYAPTRVVFGRKTEEQTGALVRQFGGSRVLIAYGLAEPEHDVWELGAPCVPRLPAALCALRAQCHGRDRRQR